MEHEWNCDLEKEMRKKMFYEFWVTSIIIQIFIITFFVVLIIIIEELRLLLVPFFLITEIALIKIDYSEFLDWKALQSRTFIEITGTVIRYAKQIGGVRGCQTYFLPVVKDDKTGEEVELDIRMYAARKQHHKGIFTEGIGERYTFLYLPNTKKAVCKRAYKFYEEE